MRAQITITGLLAAAVLSCMIPLAAGLVRSEWQCLLCMLHAPDCCHNSACSVRRKGYHSDFRARLPEREGMLPLSPPSQRRLASGPVIETRYCDHSMTEI